MRGDRIKTWSDFWSFTWERRFVYFVYVTCRSEIVFVRHSLTAICVKFKKWSLENECNIILFSHRKYLSYNRFTIWTHKKLSGLHSQKCQTILCSFCHFFILAHNNFQSSQYMQTPYNHVGTSSSNLLIQIYAKQQQIRARACVCVWKIQQLWASRREKTEQIVIMLAYTYSNRKHTNTNRILFIDKNRTIKCCMVEYNYKINVHNWDRPSK